MSAFLAGGTDPLGAIGAPDRIHREDHSASTFTITSASSAAGTITLTVRGELDLASAVEFDAVAAQVCSSDCHDLRVDVAQLTFCDCAGLSRFVTLRKRMHDVGATFALIDVGPRLARLLNVAGLDRFLCS